MSKILPCVLYITQKHAFHHLLYRDFQRNCINLILRIIPIAIGKKKLGIGLITKTGHWSRYKNSLLVLLQKLGIDPITNFRPHRTSMNLWLFTTRFTITMHVFASD